MLNLKRRVIYLRWSLRSSIVLRDEAVSVQDGTRYSLSPLVSTAGHTDVPFNNWIKFTDHQLSAKTAFA